MTAKRMPNEWHEVGGTDARINRTLRSIMQQYTPSDIPDIGVDL